MCTHGHNTHDTSTAAPKPYMTCREVLDFLMAYLDGELTREQEYEFERHMAVCPSCVNYLSSYKQTVRMGKAAFSDPEDPAAESVPEGLLAAIRKARGHK